MPLVAGGTAMNPMTSFTYRSVGVNVAVTPRVTYDGDIILDLEVESSTKGSDVNIAGQNLPSFGSRKVTTRMRLRDGESNLLAGPAARRRAEVADRLPRRHPRAGDQAALLGQRRADLADRHRDAADAAHHPDAGADRATPAGDLHRHRAEPGARRHAAADWAGDRSPRKSRRRQRPPFRPQPLRSPPSRTGHRVRRWSAARRWASRPQPAHRSCRRAPRRFQGP